MTDSHGVVKIQVHNCIKIDFSQYFSDKSTGGVIPERAIALAFRTSKNPDITLSRMCLHVPRGLINHNFVLWIKGL